ncbi:MAG: hypothetical protein ACREMY_01030, partial [bacterium]
PPVNADYSWLNQGSATVTANGDIVLATNSEVINIRARTLTATYSVSTSPLVQFSVEMGFYLPIIASANQIWGGMVIKNSGDAKLNTFAPIYSGGFKLEADKWNSVTGFNAAITSIAASNALSQIYWLKFLDDGTNLNFYVSSTGLNWVKITSAARTSFLTSPNTWGFFLLNLSSGYDAVGMRVFHVKTGTS